MARGHGPGDVIEALPERHHQFRRPLVGTGRLTHRLNGGQDVVECHGIEREHLGAAPEMCQCLVHLADIHRAHGAEVLRHHEVGIDAAERALVQGVEILAGGHAGPYHGIDLRG